MKASARAAAAAGAIALLAACATVAEDEGPGTGGSEHGLSIWVPSVVHWMARGGRSLGFTLENGTRRTISVVDADPVRAGVVIYSGAGTDWLCGVEPQDSAQGREVSLAPGDQLPIEVDLRSACRELGPGEYRFELRYKLRRAGGRGAVSLMTRHGTLIVDAPSRETPPEGPRRITKRPSHVRHGSSR